MSALSPHLLPLLPSRYLSISLLAISPTERSLAILCVVSGRGEEEEDRSTRACCPPFSGEEFGVSPWGLIQSHTEMQRQDLLLPSPLRCLHIYPITQPHEKTRTHSPCFVLANTLTVPPDTYAGQPHPFRGHKIESHIHTHLHAHTSYTHRHMLILVLHMHTQSHSLHTLSHSHNQHHCRHTLTTHTVTATYPWGSCTQLHKSHRHTQSHTWADTTDTTTHTEASSWTH